MTIHTRNKQLHWPRVYRYAVADIAQRPRFVWNEYNLHERGRARLGMALVIGRYAYCLKWLLARASRTYGPDEIVATYPMANIHKYERVTS